MNVFKSILLLVILTLSALSFTGCSSLVNEDENAQQTPWAGPANWENQMPGMPTRGY